MFEEAFRVLLHSDNIAIVVLAVMLALSVWANIIQFRLASKIRQEHRMDRDAQWATIKQFEDVINKATIVLEVIRDRLQR